MLAVERLRKVNALVGFTRIDALDRVGDLPRRLVPLTRARYPEWTVATEDRGEGIFLQLAEPAVAAWETRVLEPTCGRRTGRRTGATSSAGSPRPPENVDPDSRLKPPRYWLVHTLAHVLIREFAMTCGYCAASLSERLYAWPAVRGQARGGRAADLTTASDSDGTLGGLVQLSEPARLERVVSSALHRAARCSSDPVCAMRTPGDTGGLPARRGLPLLRHGVGDLLRAGQPVPRPAIPAGPAGELTWLLLLKPRSGSSSPAPRRSRSRTGSVTVTR